MSELTPLRQESYELIDLYERQALNLSLGHIGALGAWMDELGETYSEISGLTRDDLHYSDRRTSPDGRVLEPLFKTADHLQYQYNFRKTLDELLSSGELEKANKQRLGAKGANLTDISNVLDALKEKGYPVTNRLTVPRFTVIETPVYDKWKHRQGITQELDPIVAWMSENPKARYMARSSAVNSEDGEHTGAGRYDSVFLPEPATKEDLLKAVRQVYRSVNSPRAKKYREQIGVTDEKMAVVIQEIASQELDQAKLITINSVMPQVPELAGYVLDEGPHPLAGTSRYPSIRHALPLNRAGMLQEFGSPSFSDDACAPRFHVPPDKLIHDPEESWGATQAALLAEAIIGRPVQVEVVSNHGSSYFHIVQARPLPESYLKPREFAGFPDDLTAIYEGRGVGVINGDRAVAIDGDVIRSVSINKKLETPDQLLFVHRSSFTHGGTADVVRESIQKLPEALKSRIITMVFHPPNKSSGSLGHFETLYAELGLPLIFADRKNPQTTAIYKGQKVLVYSNGYEAIIYEAPGNPEVDPFDRELLG